MTKNSLIELKGEMNQKLIDLTSNLYRLTLLFPKKEPLRYKMRELANNILADFVRINDEKIPFGKNEKNRVSQILKNLEVLDSFFEIALIQNWVSPSELLAIKQEYDSLKRQIKDLSSEKEEADFKEKLNNENQSVSQVSAPQSFELISTKELNQRQERILSFLRQNGKAQVWQIKEIMSDVAKRTLRRDFEYMTQQGLIERVGEKNDTFYRLRTVET